MCVSWRPRTDGRTDGRRFLIPNHDTRIARMEITAFFSLFYEPARKGYRTAGRTQEKMAAVYWYFDDFHISHSFSPLFFPEGVCFHLPFCQSRDDLEEDHWPWPAAPFRGPGWLAGFAWTKQGRTAWESINTQHWVGECSVYLPDGGNLGGHVALEVWVGLGGGAIACIKAGQGRLAVGYLSTYLFSSSVRC